MTWTSPVRLFLAALILACGGKEGKDDVSNSTAVSDDSASSGGDESTNDAATDTSATDVEQPGGDGATDGGECVEAGETCDANDLCNSWMCTCMSGFEFTAVGTCEAGTCTSDGRNVCDPACANNGGTSTAEQLGCT